MNESSATAHELWARFRLTVVGHLLSAPPPEGRLEAALTELSEREWQHPTRDGERVKFAFSTIQRWYYLAKESPNPIDALRREVRDDAGRTKAVHQALQAILRKQYEQYPGWTYQLHYENLLERIEKDSSLRPVPSYPSVRRFMKSNGLRRTKRSGNESRPGLARARERLDRREVRSFEVEYVGALWHFDFHTSKHVGVLDSQGNWVKPKLLAVMDDHSRLCCHAQFYLEENTQVLVHSFTQALLKRGLPWDVMCDNGGPMSSAEFVEGLERLSITRDPTLPYSPYQNGKQEHFWSVVETRFLAMLDKMKDLSLDRLNLLLQAWVERDYHCRNHSEIGEKPSERFFKAANVLRPAPSPQAIRDVFRQRVTRRVRRSDVTVTIDGKRFELPAAHRHHDRVTLVFARWDLSYVHLFDLRSGKQLMRIFPLDPHRNAAGERRALEQQPADPSVEIVQGLPPLLERLLEEYQADGLPPAFLPYEQDLEQDAEHTS